MFKHRARSQHIKRMTNPKYFQAALSTVNYRKSRFKSPLVHGRYQKVYGRIASAY